jgi:hypothetical protein
VYVWIRIWEKDQEERKIGADKVYIGGKQCKTLSQSRSMSAPRAGEASRKAATASVGARGGKETVAALQ